MSRISKTKLPEGACDLDTTRKKQPRMTRRGRRPQPKQSRARLCCYAGPKNRAKKTRSFSVVLRITPIGSGQTSFHRGGAEDAPRIAENDRGNPGARASGRDGLLRARRAPAKPAGRVLSRGEARSEEPRLSMGSPARFPPGSGPSLLQKAVSSARSCL
jgi:hypothetical protein